MAVAEDGTIEGIFRQKTNGDLYQKPASSLPLETFDGWSGQIGVYGGASPNWLDKAQGKAYSWVYEPNTPNFDPSNVQEANQSFRLLYNGQESWGSLAINLTQPKDLSSSVLSFWLKRPKGTENLKLILRDTKARDFSPQLILDLSPYFKEGSDWQKVELPSALLSNGQIDLSQVSMIGFDISGNLAGDHVYLDDVRVEGGQTWTLLGTVTN